MLPKIWLKWDPPIDRKKWVSLVPAAVIIPAPLAYIKVVAVKCLFLASGDFLWSVRGLWHQGFLLVTPHQGSEGTLPVCWDANSQFPQQGRSVGSAGTHSQAGSANPQPRQAVLVPTPARKKWVSLVPAAAIIPAPLHILKLLQLIAHRWVPPARKECRYRWVLLKLDFLGAWNLTGLSIIWLLQLL